MLEAAVFTYGMLISVVLSNLSRNGKARRPNSAMLEYVGYILCGSLAAAAVILAGLAIRSL